MKKKSNISVVLGIVSILLIFSFNNCQRTESQTGIETTPSSKGVEIGNPMSGVAVLPKVYLDSTFPKLPPHRRVLTVGASGRDFSDCQSAVNAASPGDEVVIDARFVCSHLVLPNKGRSEKYIVIRTANLSALPPEGTRISKTDAANLAVIEAIDNEFAVGFADIVPGSKSVGAPNHYYLLGLEIRVNPKVNVLNEYIVKLRNGGKSLEQLPHDIVIGRSWIHGHHDQQVRRGIDLNGLRISVVDSIIEEIHRHGESSQGIAAWDAAAGPYKITNNEFVVAGAALLFGWQSSIKDLIPSDIEVRNNLFRKSLNWKSPVASNNGRTDYWLLGETVVLRSAQRILFEGNRFQDDWARIPEGSNYIGRAFSITPTSFGQSWARVQDVTIKNNVMDRIAGGFSISYQDKTISEVVAQRIQISNNVAYNLDEKSDRGFIWLQGQASGPVVMNHNTFLVSSSAASAFIMGEKSGLFSHFTFTDNIVHDTGGGIVSWGFNANSGAVLNAQFAEIVFHHNVLAGQDPQSYGKYADQNYFPADLKKIGFESDVANGVSRPEDLRIQDASPYARAASDGQAIGADIGILLTSQK